MSTPPTIITGPLTSKVSKAQAEAGLVGHPEFPKGASFTLQEIEGRWVAAIAPKVAEGNPFGGPPADEAPAPDGPPMDGPPSDDAPSDEKPEGDSEDKPKKDEKGGEKSELNELKDMLTKIVQALGLDAGPEDSMVPGADDMGPPPPPDAPHEGDPGDGKTHTVHERALKPGESPPGTTPIGAPSFASVKKVAANHPWHDVIGVKRTFTVEETIGDMKLADVHAQLTELCGDTGYKVAQLVESRDGAGQRTAKALISA